MEPRIDLIVGLGNPEPRYEATRHNAGFWFVDALVHHLRGQFKRQSRFHGETCQVTLAGSECWVLKPDTYMNHSGRAVAALCSYYKLPIEQVLVAHDDLDLTPGTARLKRGGGHGGHNGLRSIMETMGEAAFLRLRLGIGHPGHRDMVTDYVLSKPSQDDRSLIESAIFDALQVLPDLAGGGLQRAMHKLHTQKAEEREKGKE